MNRWYISGSQPSSLRDLFSAMMNSDCYVFYCCYMLFNMQHYLYRTADKLYSQPEQWRQWLQEDGVKWGI